MRVFKYPLPQPDEYNASYVLMPRDAEVLSVGIQKDQIVVWAMVKDHHDTHLLHRCFIVVNTGTYVIPFNRFIGTVTTSTGVVWHIFE